MPMRGEAESVMLHLPFKNELSAAILLFWLHPPPRVLMMTGPCQITRTQYQFQRELVSVFLVPTINPLISAVAV